jgi:hypothetical protein
MRHLRSLLESRPITGRIPDQTMLAFNPIPGANLDRIQATRAADGSYGWVYIPNGGVTSVNMTKLAGPNVNASWYSPRDGAYRPIGQYLNTGFRNFDAPGATANGNDWVLVLDSYDPLWPFDFAAEGASFLKTPGTSGAVGTGYARVEDDRSTAPDGMAIFGLRQNGVLVTEASVATVEATTGGRIYAEVNDRVDTGIAIANPNNGEVTMSFFFTDSAGNNFAAGTLAIAGKSGISRFLSQAPFSASTVLGTLTFQSTSPVAVTALRGFTNERGEFLITALPVVALTPASGELVFPHFADGAGWATQVVLINSSDEAITGSLQFYGGGTTTNPAQPLNLTIDGQTGSSFSFSIQPRSSQRLQTSGNGSTVQVGSIRVTANGSLGPHGLAIFRYRSPSGIITSEAGVSAIKPDRMFRLYSESAGPALQTGVAIVNASPSGELVDLELSGLDGASLARISLSIPANGHVAKFLHELPGFESVSGIFQGMLRVTAGPSGRIAVSGLRVRQNERQETLTTTIAVVAESAGSFVKERFFPMFADGGGYTTQFVVFGGQGQAGSGKLQLFIAPG